MNEPKRIQSTFEFISMRVLEPATLIYLTTCIVFYSLFTIPAFPKFLASVNMNTIIRPLLRNIGIFLCAAEAVFSFRIGKGPGRQLLYGMVVTTAFSAWQQNAYGTDSNINSILWMSIVFILGYSAVYHYNRRTVHHFAVLSYMVFMVIWFIACCLSLIQFALQIGKYGPNFATSPWLQGKGFIPPRLIGIFGYPEHGASFGLLLMIMGFYWIIKTRWWILRFIIVLINLPLFFYLVLSITRNAILAMYLAVFVGSFLLFLKKVRQTAGKGILTSLGLACLVLIALFFVHMGTKKFAEHVPEHFDQTAPAARLSVTLASSPARLSSAPLSAFRSQGRSIVLLMISEPSWQNNAARYVKMPTPAESMAQADSNPSLLDRQYNSADLTSGRLQIWKDYLSMTKEIGLFGLSPENASWYIQEHHPELYICTFVKDNDPVLYERGFVIHPHSGYLKVFVSAGLVGLSCVLIFFLRCAITIVSYIRKSRHLSAEFICSLMVIVAGLSTALFEPELFFNLTNPIMFFFWVAVSILMRSMKQTGTARIRKHRRQQVRR